MVKFICLLRPIFAEKSVCWDQCLQRPTLCWEDWLLRSMYTEIIVSFDSSLCWDQSFSKVSINWDQCLLQMNASKKFMCLNFPPKRFLEIALKKFVLNWKCIEFTFWSHVFPKNTPKNWFVNWIWAWLPWKPLDNRPLTLVSAEINC